MIHLPNLAKPRVKAPLDPDFRPAELAVRSYLQEIKKSGQTQPLVIGLESGDGYISSYQTDISMAPEFKEATFRYTERLVKFLLWQRGGWKILVGGPKEIGDRIKEIYSATGARAFDFDFMSGVYEKTFCVETVDPSKIKESDSLSVPIGRHLKGCRVGLDLGASNIKISAVVDGQVLESDSIPWAPADKEDPEYHYDAIRKAILSAAEKMPRLDGVGVSTAGVLINNRVMVSSLFRGIPKDLYHARMKNIFLNLREELGIPLEIANDGDATALAGAMGLNKNRVLGIALGSSEAGGYVNSESNIIGWLNELAFCPIDYRDNAPVDEWSGDAGCGVQYLSQQGLSRLIPNSEISLPADMPIPQQPREVFKLMTEGDERARKIYETLGVYVGYGIAHYARFYDLGCVLVLGGVTSGLGGQIIVEKAHEVIKTEFPEYSNIEIQLPDDATRRIGLSVAAASLPA